MTVFWFILTVLLSIIVARLYAIFHDQDETIHRQDAIIAGQRDLIARQLALEENQTLLLTHLSVLQTHRPPHLAAPAVWVPSFLGPSGPITLN